MWVIAIREYNAAVKSKAFLVSLILFPIMMGGSAFFQVMTKKYGADIRTRRVAIVDRTPGQALFPVLQQSAEQRNKTKIFDSENGRQTEPVFELVAVEPGDESPDAIAKQRLDLSEKVRRKEFFAFIELGKNMLEVPERRENSPGTQPTRSAEDLGDDFFARYTSNSPTYLLVQRWAQSALTNAVYARRMAPFAAKLSQEQILGLMAPPAVIPRSLAKVEPDGKIGYEVAQNQIVTFILPLALIILMFMIVVVGASPMAMNVMEEKQMRIAEVLLGSVRPFDLMMGKLMGGAGVALTLMAIYLTGAYWAVNKILPGDIQVGQVLTPQLLFWFVIFCIVSVFMYGAMFVAAGAAVSNAKEAQSLITPIMLLFILPMMVFGPMIQSPSGTLAMIFGFFPPSSPMVTMARLSIPPGIPFWQPIVALAMVVLTTVAIVWAAGRIFRVGILMQGQGAKPMELLSWIAKG